MAMAKCIRNLLVGLIFEGTEPSCIVIIHEHRVSKYEDVSIYSFIDVVLVSKDFVVDNVNTN
jgi:hypothetical protein